MKASAKAFVVKVVMRLSLLERRAPIEVSSMAKIVRSFGRKIEIASKKDRLCLECQFSINFIERNYKLN